MRATRRGFLKGSIAGGATICMGRLLTACSNAEGLPQPAERPLLTFPPTWDGGPLEARRSTLEIRAGIATEVWTIGGSFPSPTIRVRKGDMFEVELSNQLDEPTNIHWHGLSVPADTDGHPKDVIASGASRTYRFPVLERAGTYWYHPHPHEETAKQVYLGMAGLFIVEDDEEQALELPRGDLDLPLLIQDRRFATGELSYAPEASDVANGYLGETIFVNGVPNPRHPISADLHRLRILNGSNARTFKLVFSDGRTMHLIGTDGGLLDQAIAVTDVWVAPGERVDLLVDFSLDAIGATPTLMSDSFMIGEGGGGHGAHGGSAGVVRQGARLELLRFEVNRAATQALSVPTSLGALDRLDTGGASMRPFELTAHHEAHSGIHTINGKLFDVARIDEQVTFGSTEIWRVQSMDDASIHPMHVHGLQFQVVSRSGAMLASDRGWKDTVAVFPLETVDLAVRFSEHRGLYLFHCHTLEHEDDGMMLNVDVV